ncbi:coiled-coil domain-containing protein [Novosphingobium malaysiense]|uniref:ATPase n=1 Tax=Novosphingobium malaysiense TaxID=1348853 RepID=A0A0B1ZM46_9SPHN|nr:ATPase [Novosphingobium malaysiense]KHK91591.1 ATPase [Novosphingobium malaysiense]
MAGENRIIAFGANDGENAEVARDQATELPEAPGAQATEQETWDEALVDDTEAHDIAGSGGWIAPVLAGLAVAAWSGLFIWALLPALQAGVPLAEVPQLVMQWCVPVLLIGLVWLLALRHSTREGRRFGDVARTLSTESALLEQRLTTVNRELSLAREFIAAQSRDLESLGRMAAERLSQNAERLQDLVRDNGSRVESISTVSSAALQNMEKLRGQLPVIASSAKDVTNNIGNAGRTAQVQLENMVQGFNRLNEFGTASERQVESLRVRVSETLEEFQRQAEQFQAIAEERFAALAERGEEFRIDLDKHEVDAIASLRSRASALAAEIDSTRHELDEHEAQSLTSLRARLVSLRDESDVVARALREGEVRAREALKESLAALEADQAASTDRIAEAHRGAIDALKESLESLREEQSSAAAGFRLTQQDVIKTLKASLEALRQEQSTASEAIAATQQAAVDALSARLATLSDEADRMDAALGERAEKFTIEAEERQARQVEQERHAITRIEHMLGELDGNIAERLERHRRQTTALAERAQAVTEELERFEARLADIAGQSGETESNLTASLEALTERLTAARATLTATDRDVEKLTEDSVRLLELIQASAKNTHSALPEALAVSEGRLVRLESGVSDLLDVLRESAESSEDLASGIEQSGANLKSLVAQLADAQSAIVSQNNIHSEHLQRLQDTLAEIDQSTERLSGKARDELTAAIAALRATLAESVESIENDSAARIASVAEALSEESGKAIDRAMRAKVSEISGQLEQAVSHASGVSREATIQLRDQLAKVDELTGNLENRVAHARSRAEEQVDNDFARRVALITESLNSNSIDIAGALSTDVADTAWAAYLRGDRGIFTRRAVRLLESGEVKQIQQLFERDDTFREHVSRYIHDFEAVLRQVLSTRDGNALGVTLLSSDMGKLYVALAQGIERLRG